MTGFEYSGGAVMIQQLALTDAVGKPFADLAREWVLNPIGMTNSSYEQPLPPGREKQAARAHNRMGARMGDPWYVCIRSRPRPACGPRRPSARFAIEVQMALLWKSNRVLSQTTAQEMVTPVGVGPFAVGFQIIKKARAAFPARRQQLGFPMRPHRASGERLRRGHHDQQRQRRGRARTVDAADPAGIQVGCAGRPDPATAWPDVNEFLEPRSWFRVRSLVPRAVCGAECRVLSAECGVCALCGCAACGVFDLAEYPVGSRS